MSDITVVCLVATVMTILATLVAYRIGVDDGIKQGRAMAQRQSHVPPRPLPPRSRPLPPIDGD